MLCCGSIALGQSTRPEVTAADSMADALKALARRDPYPLVALLERPDLSEELQSASTQLLSDFGMRGTVALLRSAKRNPGLLPILLKLTQRPATDRLDAVMRALWEAPGFEAALRADDALRGGVVPSDSQEAGSLAATVDWFGIAALIPYVTDPAVEVRAPIAAAMARLEHPAGFRILATLLASEDPVVVGTTLESIAVALPKGAIEAAERFLDADDEARVSGAIAVIAALGASIDPQRGIPALALVRPPINQDLMDAMKRHADAERLPALLVDALAVGDVRDPVWVAREAVRMGQRRARGFAESLVFHPNPALRMVALDIVATESTASVSDAPARLALFEAAARDESPWVRWAAARGLATVVDQIARATLVILLGDSFGPVREEAATALAAQQSREATPPLRRAAVEDKDSSVRNAARLALLRFGVVTDVSLIVDDAFDDLLGPRTRTFLTEWLGSRTDLARGPLEAAIRARASRSR